ATGPAREFAICSSQTVIQILPYLTDGAAFVSVEPCITLVDNDGKVLTQVRSETFPVSTNDLLDKDPGELLVSKDGGRVYLRGVGEGRGVVFDLRSNAPSDN